ncbi:hypothetical protein BJ322DRAFT_697293 [Thelephora terrestris]|uniref:Uncharacterized protein n=1 Tax=Thelephora terrestris TaxID=56493 RepID=A0A9P6L8D2_9AGAM|nr:hypothetical protein BJ322DRAFT_697293 [Thelephora terrestris]
MAGPQQLLLHLTVLITFAFSSLAAHVSWSSPAAGAVFGPGDTLTASWTANSTTNTKGSKNSTAAFRLCEAGSQVSSNGTTGCGTAVTPLIQQSAGSYTTTFALPNVTNNVGMYLEMDDASGLKSISPNFSLSPTIGTLNGTLANTTRTELPDINENRVPVPVAALAIPLSFVGLILLCCLSLCFFHHRKLNQERAHDLQRLALAREKLGYGLKQVSPKPSGSHVIYLDSRPTSPGRKFSFKEPVKRGWSYYEDAYTPVYYNRTRSSDSTPPESPRYYHQRQHSPSHPSSRSHSRREGEPRQYTREPFYTNMDRTPMDPLERGPSLDYFQLPYGYQPTSRSKQDPRNVPAGLFRSVKSPAMHQQRDETPPHRSAQSRSAYPAPPGLGQHQSYRSERGRGDEHPHIRISRATTAATLQTRPPTPPERSSRPVPRNHQYGSREYASEPSIWEREREEEDAYVNDGLIANYLAASPTPNQNTSHVAAIPACLSPRVPAQPDRLHVRREARLLDFEKPLPSAPSRGYGYAVDEDPVYRAVSDALGRR